VGALMIRSFEHADRLYFAMLLRGYNGRPVTLRPMRLTVRDTAFAGGFLGFAALGLAFGGMLHA